MKEKVFYPWSKHLIKYWLDAHPDYEIVGFVSKKYKNKKETKTIAFYKDTK